MPGVLRKPQHRAVRPVPAAAVLIWHTSPLSRKNKNTSHAQGGIRGEFLAVPLSFLTFPAAIGAEPGAITPRAPGRTSHPASPGPLSAGEGPSLFAGADAETIRLEPYVPEFLELHGKVARDFGLPIDPEAPVILAPNVGSYVGGDITAGVLDTLLWDRDEMSLFVDLGTNGELVYGNRDFMLCCACSAGPAFEGGDISCGMRATSGAIESCSIDEETLEPSFVVVGEPGTKPIGLCGSGLIDVISELFRCGIIDARGKFVKEGRRIQRDEYGASYILAFPEDSGHGREVEINEVDLDNFIRAKGAIFSAIVSMLNSLDMPVDVIEKIQIAGGIGSGIDIAKAISIGMLPKLPLEKYSYIGNSSLSGACAMLLSSQAEEKVFEIGRNMTYLELSTHPGYMEEFVAACFLPHTNASLFE